MVLSEAQAVWGKEISKLEQLTGKKIITLQDGIDAIKVRMSEIEALTRLSYSDIDVLRILGYYAEALVTIQLADKKYQDYLQEERRKCITNISCTLDLLNK